MGCTPSKSTGIYTQDKVCRDLDTCSTFVPSLKSSVSTPERPSPRLSVENNSGRLTYLSVPCRDVNGRSASQSSQSESFDSPSSSSWADQHDMKPRKSTQDLHTDTEGMLK